MTDRTAPLGRTPSYAETQARSDAALGVLALVLGAALLLGGITLGIAWTWPDILSPPVPACLARV